MKVILLSEKDFQMLKKRLGDYLHHTGVNADLQRYEKRRTGLPGVIEPEVRRKHIEAIHLYRVVVSANEDGLGQVPQVRLRV